MIRIKLEVIGDTKRGPTNMGTFEYEVEVTGQKLVINQRIDQILMKDKTVGRYFLTDLVIETKGKDID